MNLIPAMTDNTISEGVWHATEVLIGHMSSTVWINLGDLNLNIHVCRWCKIGINRILHAFGYQKL